MAAFKNFSDLEKALNKSINTAVENSCNRLLGTLQEIIDSEYYDVFDPEYYKRTYQFWRSAVTKMFRQNCGVVFMDKTAMNYNTFWTGEKQLLHASRGSHGGFVTDETRQHRFWEVFINFCQNNAVNILKEELKKQGIPVK